MAGRTMDVSVLVRLVDRITGPLGAIQRKFAQFAAIGQRIGILGAAVAALSFMAPIQSAARFDQQLRESVVTAGLWGDAAEARIRQVSQGFEALSFKVGTASEALAAGAGLLVAAGMSDALAERIMPTIGKVAKASSAAVLDVSKVNFAMSDTLKIADDQLEKANAMLVVAGKLGRFEFKDMAAVIPGLAGQLQSLGVTGFEAVATIGASLQVAMFGTDSTATAANNFKNFLSKLASTDAIDRFKGVGVDIIKVMADATARGLNPVEAVMEKLTRLTKIPAAEVDAILKKAKASGMTDTEATAELRKRIEAVIGRSKIGEVFSDMQVLDFLTPFLANVDRYLAFKKEIGSASTDVIGQDFATQMAGLSTQLTITGEIGEQAIRRIGLAFAKNLPWINELGIAALAWVREVDAQYPGVIDQVLAIGGAFLAAVAGLAIMVPVLTVLSAAFGVLAGVIGFVLSPIGLLVAALAGLAYLIYSEWDEFAPYFQDMWNMVTAAFDAGVAMVKALFAGDWAGAQAAGAQVLSALGDLGNTVLDVLSMALSPVLATVDEKLGGIPSKLVSIGSGIGTALGAAWDVLASRWGPGMEAAARGAIDWATGLPGQIVSAFGGDGGAVSKWFADLGPRALAALSQTIDDLAGAGDAEWAALGTRLGNAIADSVEKAVDGLASFFSGLPSRIMGWIGSIDIGSLIKWPSLPSWLGGEGEAPKTPGNDNKPPPAPASGMPGGGRYGRFAPASSVAGNAQVGGQIVVSAAPGSQVESVKSSNPAVPLKRSDNGRVVGRV